MSFDLDIAIVVGFLIVNLGVGLYYGQGVKNIKEYALGGRNFSTPTLIATIVATWLSGDFFSFYLTETYTEGLFFILASSGFLVSFFIIAYIYAPRMTEFLGDLSIAEAMGRLYGKHARLITAFVGIVFVATMVSMQFKITSTIMVYLLGVSGIYATIASAVIVIIYSGLGGIKTITFTDVIQFFTFGAVIPVISLIIWSGIEDVDIVIKTVQTNPLFDMGLLLDYSTPRFWSFITLMLLFIIPGLDPSIFQRISMSSNTQQLRRVFVYSAFATFTVQLLISWIALLILSREPNLNPDDLFGYILENYAYVGLKGIFIVGVLAMMMSTADSDLNSGSVMFAYDIVGTLKFIKPSHELLISRIAVVVTGSIGMFLTIVFDDLLTLFIFGYSFYMPVVTVPITLAVLGFRTSPASALVGMGSGFAVALGWMFLDTEVDSVIPGLLANLFAMLGYHYLTGQPGGWTPKPTNDKVRVSIFQRTMSGLQEFKFLKFCNKSLPKSESVYVLFALFTIVSIFSTNYPLSMAISNKYQYLIHGLYFSTLIIATYFLMYPMLPKARYGKSALAIIWIGSVGYTLVFVAGLLVILSNFGQFQLVMFIFNMLVLALLVRWQAALFLMISGTIASVQIFEYYVDAWNLTSDISTDKFNILYIMVLVASILVAFLKPKQEYLEGAEERAGYLGKKIDGLNEKVTHYNERISDQELEIERLGATAQKILNNLNHELRLPVGNVMNFAEMLNDGLESYNKKQLRTLADEVYKNSNRLSSMILNMLDLATLSARKLELKHEDVNFSQLVCERVKRCRKIYLEGKKLEFNFNIEPDIMVSADLNYIRQTVDNLAINAIRFSEKGKIDITVSKQKNSVEFTIKDEGKGIPKSELYDIFTPFKMGSNSESKAEGRGVGLALCRAALEAHGGVIKADSNGTTGAEFRFLLPF